MAEAVDIVAKWLTSPAILLLEPGPQHWDMLRKVLVEAQVSGPLVTDAVIAAQVLRHGAAVCTTDRDFRRFSGLRLIDPLAS